MKVTYYEDEDSLVIRLSDKTVAREVSQGRHTHIGYASDGTVVETVIPEAAAQLNGTPSMMSPQGGPMPKGHDHGAVK